MGLDVLAQGLGHYPGTNLPGEVGNLAIAGHRAGHGNPLIDIDAIQPGDVLVIETREAYFVYRAVRHEIVDPTDAAVIDPVPEQPGATPTQRWFTLTSCSPRYGSSSRYIVFSSSSRRSRTRRGCPSRSSPTRPRRPEVYAALWRRLPGGRWAKGLEALVLVVLVVAVLFQWVFPAVTPYLPFENVTVQAPSPSSTSTSNPSP